MNTSAVHTYLYKNYKTLPCLETSWTFVLSFQEGKWIWVKNADPVEFSAWGQNEPNNGGSGEDCLHILVDRGYYWNDAPCDENSLHGYPNKPICQKRFRLS